MSISRAVPLLWLGLVIAILLPALPLHAEEWDSLSSEARKMAENACNTEKYTEGPAAYYACMKKQARAVKGVKPPDLTGLTREERGMAENACNTERYTGGPAAFYTCMAKQVNASKGARPPDLSTLSSEERRMAENACNTEKYTEGPAAFYSCMAKQAQARKGAQPPDLSGLSREERRMAENACNTEKFTEGPAAYYACMRRQVDALVETQILPEGTSKSGKKASSHTTSKPATTNSSDEVLDFDDQAQGASYKPSSSYISPVTSPSTYSYPSTSGTSSVSTPRNFYTPSSTDSVESTGYCAENGSCYGDISDKTGKPKTVPVNGYYRKDGTYVRGHFRSK